jgi:hypothetical protein
MVRVFSISTEPGRPAATAPAQRRGQALLPLTVSLIMLILGLPRFVSSLSMVPAEQVIERLLQNGTVSDEALESAESRFSLARHFSTSGRIAIDLAAVKLAEADRLPVPAQSTRAGVVADAEELLRQGLSDDPTESFGWSQLAYARRLESGVGAAAVDAWRMSVLTAPADRRLSLWRTRFGIESSLAFSEGDENLLDRQIQFAWTFNRTELARYAKSAGPEAVQTIRAALANQPDDVKSLRASDALIVRNSEFSSTGCSRGRE